MLRRILAWLTGRGDDEADDESGRFVPSELDISVREAHGSGRAEAERELASIEAQARLLEENEDQHEPER
ncbi:hypothetical protein [Haloglomus salinum]|jgi:hypothetical protein|uniref:hypothetical protein n=1 Tax=Haloglomus salinum TaxID=2962673 RepID=UPI0020C9B418|nr:hypothetical protein [Haloglomus salinum]